VAPSLPSDDVLLLADVLSVPPPDESPLPDPTRGSLPPFCSQPVSHTHCRAQPAYDRLSVVWRRNLGCRREAYKDVEKASPLEQVAEGGHGGRMDWGDGDQFDGGGGVGRQTMLGGSSIRGGCIVVEPRIWLHRSTRRRLK